MAAKHQAPIIVEAKLPASTESVWRTITQAELMRQWFFPEIGVFEAVPGFQTQFDVEFDGEVYVHLWRLIAVEPEKRISYDWRYEGHNGRAIVDFELEPVEGSTLVTLTHTVTTPFPSDNPAFSRESTKAGWTYFIQENLAEFLA